MERSKIKLVKTPYWLKINLCPPECDKDDLIHAVGATLEEVLKLVSKGNYVVCTTY